MKLWHLILVLICIGVLAPVSHPLSSAALEEISLAQDQLGAAVLMKRLLVQRRKCSKKKKKKGDFTLVCECAFADAYARTHAQTFRSPCQKSEGISINKSRRHVNV